MAKRCVNPIIHIFVPEDSAKSSKRRGVSCEINYFDYLFKRRLSMANWQLKMYTYRQKSDFIKQLRNERKNKDSQDLFFVILDADIGANPSPKEIGIRSKQIHEEYKRMKEKNKKVKFILSSRCWEVWMCMHKEGPYMKPFSTQEELNKDVHETYQKERQWYKEKADFLFKSCKQASRNSKLSRNAQKLTLIDFEKVESIQNFFKKCTQQATFVDILVDELNEKIV
ncbi:RloB domain-containing protein [Pediococcus acidilactici]|uniref:RloB domain-containing protein n=2 Tax=Pediococcus acidilactici TaxID=1254 RepID=UPI001320D6D2|nr:RloB domain-containing protein [Pediococcus acidilactici]KAF0335608.1 hypothetical protein GBO20_05735 [Pediococcus acidilactici]KAF0337638.1 hypothetical protein GBO39_04495 [Pediococcus acidilactici]KAF0339162.1 hypothetical protein GBO40_06855 [Pediococcus acidilactici]KAF0345080.1 hypothetical protein GBO43_06500 [Pediococcus acidilactici]KAF0348315.1 hypothetical protein GBO45_07790 [Pediococcus acidilactici]